MLGSRIDECYKQSLRECEVDLEFEMEKNMGREGKERGGIPYVEKIVCEKPELPMRTFFM